MGPWKKVKAGALRGWTLAADGRLYHAVLSPLAAEAWTRKVEKLDRRRKDTLRKAERVEAIFDDDDDAWNSNGILAEGTRNSDGIPAENGTRRRGRKREREGE